MTALRARSRTSGRFPRVPRSPAALTASSSSRRRDVASHPPRKTTSPGSLSERSAPAGPATAGRTKQPGRKGGSAGALGGGRRGKSPPHLPGEGESVSRPEPGVFLAPAVGYRRWVPTVPGDLSKVSWTVSGGSFPLPLPITGTLQAPASVPAVLQPRALSWEGPSFPPAAPLAPPCARQTARLGLAVEGSHLPGSEPAGIKAQTSAKAEAPRRAEQRPHRGTGSKSKD